MSADYASMTKDQLIAVIKNLEKQRYGLVWEDKREEVAEQCERELPVLAEDKDKEIKAADSENPTHIIIEGDNYHALYALGFTHRKKIDVIYIDPPYNTGNKSWKYNNDYIDKEDKFRHSKWLSFMNKRLRLAKTLLKDSGIFVCAIDDYEFAGLKLLCDDIFGEENRLGTCVVIHNPGGRQDEKYFPTAHEYMLIYGKKAAKAKIFTLELSDNKIAQFKNQDPYGKYKLRGYRRSGANSRKEDRPNLYYPIYYDEKSGNLSTTETKGSIRLLPVDADGIKRCWRWNSETFEQKKDKYIEVKVINNQIDLFVKEREDDNKGERAKTIWHKPKYASVGGTSVIKSIFGNQNKVFDYPKSLDLMRDILKITTDKSALILDFFAGSGTTGHAVLELNKEDGGSRQFILCTNNENKICEEVTYPRIKKAIEGYAGKKGIPANVKYFKTNFVPAVKTNSDKRTLVDRSTELLCLAENTFEPVYRAKKKLDFALFKNAKTLTAIIYDEDVIPDACAKLNKIDFPHKTAIYVFSYDQDYDASDFSSLQIKFTVKPIPEAILNVYRKNAKLRKK